MINVSKTFKQELYNGRQDFLLSAGITFADGAEKQLDDIDIWENGLSVEDAVSSDSSFDIGAAVTNRCTLVVNNMYDKFSAYDFTGAEIVPYVKMELPDGTIEPVRKGTFTVDEADYDEDLITLSCLDNMRKFDKPYSLSKLVYPATLGEIVRDACSVCGVILQTQTFPHYNFVIQERPSDEAATFREVISWAAQIACCFCRCDVHGRLELKWYDIQALEKASLDGGTFSPWTGGKTMDGGSFKPWTGGTVYDGGTFGDRDDIHHIYSNFSINIATDDVVITGVRVLEKTKEDDKDALVTYQSGTDGYVISIENNELIQGGTGQTVADWLGEQLIGLRFRPASATHMGDPTIEGGDVGFLTDRKGRTYRIVISNTHFTAGDSQNTSCNAETPARNSAARFSAETKAYVENRKNFQKEQTEREKALEDLKKRVDSSSGLFMTAGKQPNGSDVLYMHDKPLLSESMFVWKLTAEVWAVSTDGGKTYNASITIDGDMIARLLSVVGFSFSWGDGGTLTLGGKDDIHGILEVRDASNRLMVRIDRTGVIVGTEYNQKIQMTSQLFAFFYNNDPVGAVVSNPAGLDIFVNDLFRVMCGKAADKNTKNVIAMATNRDESKKITTDYPWEFEQKVHVKGNIYSTGEVYGSSRVLPAIYLVKYDSSEPQKRIELTDSGVKVYNTLHVEGTFVANQKANLVKTQNYDNRLLYCYEMPSPMYGDIGEGETDTEGKCCIFLDAVFAEAAASGMEYQVFLQKEGPGDLWVESKQQEFFIVKGTPGLKFAWEVKARQKNQECTRMELFDESGPEPEIDYVQQYIEERNQLIKEREEIVYETA